MTLNDCNTTPYAIKLVSLLWVEVNDSPWSVNFSDACIALCMQGVWPRL